MKLDPTRLRPKTRHKINVWTLWCVTFSAPFLLWGTLLSLKFGMFVTVLFSIIALQLAAFGNVQTGDVRKKQED